MLIKLIKVISFILLVFSPSISEATVLYLSNAESGTCDTATTNSVWDITGSQNGENARMWYRCDTPVPNTGRSKYFRINTVNNQNEAYGEHNVSTINLSHGTTYYLGVFFRFDRVGGNDVWHDTNQPDSYDKYFETSGGIRVMFMAGWPNALYSACNGTACNGKYTMGVYLSCSGCDQTNDGGQSGCCAEKYQNVSPYASSNPILLDYGRWYAGVIAVDPSTTSSSNDGTIDLYINGTHVYHFAGVTQNNSSPYVSGFRYGGTIAQPGYDAPAHLRKMDYFIFSDSLTDMQNARLMEDPEGADSTPDAFSFTDVNGAALSTVTTTNPCATIAGIDAGQTPTASISGAGCTFNVDGGAYASDNTTVGLDNVVCLRGTSSGSYSTVLPSCTLTVGGVTDSGAPWTVTTLAAVSDPVAPRFRGSSMTGGWR